MSDGNFSEFIARTRERLNQERQAIFGQQRELEKKLDEITSEFQAIEAYESPRTGRGSSQPSNRRRARPGSRREELLQVIRNAGGLSRGEILGKLGLKGDKAAEMSVSNASTALTKAGQVVRNEAKKYIAG